MEWVKSCVKIITDIPTFQIFIEKQVRFGSEEVKINIKVAILTDLWIF